MAGYNFSINNFHCADMPLQYNGILIVVKMKEIFDELIFFISAQNKD